MAKKPSTQPEKSVRDRLAEPFLLCDVSHRIGEIAGGKCSVIWYTNARAVMDRLDDVFGPEGWRDAYEFSPNGSVMCRLSVKFDGEWIEKSDVGSQSDQEDVGDRVKAAFSDALKRAAVHFGVGRYLYKIPKVWLDYDATSRRCRQVPVLPSFAVHESERSHPATNQEVAPVAHPQEPQEPRNEGTDGRKRIAGIINGLDPADRESYQRIEKALAEGCANGSRPRLLELRRAYQGKFAASSPGVVEAAESYFWECWSLVPASAGFETDPPRQYKPFVNNGPAGEELRSPPRPSLSDKDAALYAKIIDVMILSKTKSLLLKNRASYQGKKNYSKELVAALEEYFFWAWSGAEGDEPDPPKEYRRDS